MIEPGAILKTRHGMDAMVVEFNSYTLPHSGRNGETVTEQWWSGMLLPGASPCAWGVDGTYLHSRAPHNLDLIVPVAESS